MFIKKYKILISFIGLIFYTIIIHKISMCSSTSNEVVVYKSSKPKTEIIYVNKEIPPKINPKKILEPKKIIIYKRTVDTLVREVPIPANISSVKICDDYPISFKTSLLGKDSIVLRTFSTDSLRWEESRYDVPEKTIQRRLSFLLEKDINDERLSLNYNISIKRLLLEVGARYTVGDRSIKPYAGIGFIISRK